MIDLVHGKPVVGIDIETTGLDPQKNGVVEVYAARVSYEDGRLKKEELFHSLCWPTAHWNRVAMKMHAQSGLLEEAADCGIDERLCLIRLRGELTKLSVSTCSEKVCLLGSSVHFDRNFLIGRLPILSKLLHHRVIDVSSTWQHMELLGANVNWPERVTPHRAEADLDNSLAYANAAAQYLEMHQQINQLKEEMEHLRLIEHRAWKLMNTSTTVKDRRDGFTEVHVSPTEAALLADLLPEECP